MGSRGLHGLSRSRTEARRGPHVASELLLELGPELGWKRDRLGRAGAPGADRSQGARALSPLISPGASEDVQVEFPKVRPLGEAKGTSGGRARKLVSRKEGEQERAIGPRFVGREGVLPEGVTPVLHVVSRLKASPDARQAGRGQGEERECERAEGDTGVAPREGKGVADLHAAGFERRAELLRLAGTQEGAAASRAGRARAWSPREAGRRSMGP